MICDLLSKHRLSEKVAVISNEKCYTYRQWYEKAISLSNEIKHHSSGRICGIFIPNGIHYAVSYFACLYANKVVAPFSMGTTMEEFRSMIEYCNICLIITVPECVYQIVETIDTFNLSTSILVLNEDIGVQEWHVKDVVGENQDTNEEELEDVVALLHTSGTTSKPKRVMLTNYGLLHNIKAHCVSLGLSENEVSLVQLPMMFGYCNTAQFLAHVYLGSTIVINNAPFIIGDFFRMIERWKVTNYTAVPTMLFVLSKCNKSSYDISSLKIICFGGGPVSKELLHVLFQKYPSVAFIQTYGLTEAGPRVTTLPIMDYIRKAGSVGITIPDVQIRIVDDRGEELRRGKVGQIIVNSEGKMKGYYRRNAETKIAIVNNWLYTGDMGYISEDGFLYLEGRKKNIIISGGQNVYPEEVEEIITCFRGILEAKVYGVPNDLLGEEVHADIVVEETDCFSADLLLTYCKSKLSGYKIPKQINCVELIERTYNGKIKRNPDSRVRSAGKA
jgi:long-chain acyl-CoA synthetase